jgi:hypothetical protein
LNGALAKASGAASMATKEKDAPPAPPKPSLARSLVGYGIGVGLGLAVLWLASVLLTPSPNRFIDELPHLAVMAEFDTLRLPEVRQQLATLERELQKLGLETDGPLENPILVPGKEAGDMPTSEPINVLTVDQFDRARDYLEVGNWLIPRVYGPDIQSAIIRCAPKGHVGFAPGLEEKVRHVLAMAEFSKLRLCAYSHALRLEDQEARKRINVVFGVQTVFPIAYAATKVADNADFQAHLLGALQDWQKATKRPVRSVACEGSYLLYAGAVRVHNSTFKAEHVADVDAPGLLELGHRLNMGNWTATDGQHTQIEITTEAEGEQIRELGHDVSANVARFNGLTKIIFERENLAAR